MQESIRNSGQALGGFLGRREDRFPAHVARCRNEWPGESVEEEMMQRRIGQEHTDFGEARRYPGSDPA